MGKKKSRTSQVSKGQIGNAYQHASKALRKEYRNSIERVSNQLRAFRRGRRVMLTIPNPNSAETNKRFIRVNARDVWSGGGKEKKK